MVLGELPPGAVLGTGSPRRAAQLRALGLGLQVVPIRGNVDSRISRVFAGEFDGVVIAAAGLARLGRIDEATELLDPQQMLPAPGQSALACECRVGDLDTEHALAAFLDNTGVRAAVTAERPCWPRWRPAAAPRLARSPMSSRSWATTGGWYRGCPCEGSQPLRMVTCSGRPPLGISPIPRTSAATLRRSCRTMSASAASGTRRGAATL
jgi:hypothetical protein